MLRNFLWIDFFFGTLQDSLRVASYFLVIFTSTIIGMAVCSITLYGKQYLNYSSFIPAVLY
jgi:hypothetical protein